MHYWYVHGEQKTHRFRVNPVKEQKSMAIDVAHPDSKQGPLELGRADALNARTQQSLEVVGILDDLIQQGITCNSK